jgi:hypothetical protein
MGKAAVAQFINDDTTYSPVALKAKDIGDFAWVDLADDGQYQLVMTLDVNGRSFFNALVIFWRDPSSKVAYQEVRGSGFGELKEVVRDLNGDGKKRTYRPDGPGLPQYGGDGDLAGSLPFTERNVCRSQSGFSELL